MGSLVLPQRDLDKDGTEIVLCSRSVQPSSKAPGSRAAQAPCRIPISAIDQLRDFAQIASHSLGFLKIHFLDIIVRK